MVRSGPIDSAPEGERRLAAIVFSDVVGYSARMQRDETGTMALVGVDFARMAALAADEEGEVLNTMGDGMLLAFPSAVQAVTFALQAQAEFAHRRVLKPPEKALEHRIGIHVGDVFRLDDRVAGDGVNIASRLQAKAPAGGICVSQTVYDLIRGKVTVEAVALGPQEFKNIAEKIPIYHLVLPVGGGPLRARRPGASTAIVAVVVLLTAIGALWWRYSPPGAAAAGGPPAGAVAAAAAPAVSSASAVPAPMGKSIAVLPFVNMSDSKENAYFADGVQEDILTSLANIGDLRVVSRTSVIQYRDSAKPIRQIGAELGVAYVLEGSVQRAGNRVLVTGQLINARTDEHVWAKSYDRELNDIFAIQAELSKAIAAELQAVLSPQEKARLDRLPTDNAAAYDLYLKAWAIVHSAGYNLESLTAAEPLLESAVELDPKFAQAWGILASNQDLITHRIDDVGGIHQAKSKHAIEMMEQLAPDDPESWLELGRHYLQGYAIDHKRADDYFQRAARALPNNGTATLLLAEMERRHGSWKSADGTYRRAYALDRKDPDIQRNFGQWLVIIRHYDEATAIASETPSSNALAAVIPFYARGSTSEIDAWIAAHPTASHEVLQNLYFLLGDADGYVRTMDSSRGDLPNRLSSVVFESEYASALLAQGQANKAREVATQNVARMKSDESLHAWPIAYNLVTLGQAQTALDGIDVARRQSQEEGINPDWTDNTGVRALALAQLGRKDEAVAELARLLTIPGGLNVNALRHGWLYRDLKGYPPFEALLNDPANNAPLL
jgi:TolB-like protein/class 3 adenylate cyclase/Flp pilus assembly protein TadD